MSLLGSLFSSESSSTTKNIVDETNTNNVDNRVTEGENNNIGGNITVAAGDNLSEVSITTTDFGALDTAESISMRAFETSKNAFQSSQDAVKTIAADAVDVARSLTTDNTAKTLQYGIIAAAIIGAVAIYSRIK
jgi:DNA-directed RNA polymerase